MAGGGPDGLAVGEAFCLLAARSTIVDKGNRCRRGLRIKVADRMALDRLIVVKDFGPS